MVYIATKNELRELNKELVERIRAGECGDVNIHEMLKAVSVLDTTIEGQTYLIDHGTDEKFGELVDKLNNITHDMRDGKMNITDLTAKYTQDLPQEQKI
jgi:hypothetical protein